MIATQDIVRNPSEAYLDEIINLQLKKPKSWNWELSTSKSSPHIMLPTIKLYNSKGKLLVEARDNGMQRRSWHSSDIKQAAANTKINNSTGFKDSIPRHLRKCRSDILERNHKNNIPSKFESINLSKRTSRERASKERENLLRTSKSQAESAFQAIAKNRTDALNENMESSNSCENVINSWDRKSLNHLRKSRSTVLDGCKRPVSDQTEFNILRKNRSVKDAPRSMQNGPLSYHKRTRSDDLFQRLMKYNEESIKRAIADGYRNFITPLVREKSLEAINDDVKLEDKGKNRKRYARENSEAVLLSSGYTMPEINHFTHKRYTTRTCSAGTLIISEESFNGSNHRRRRNKMSDEASTNDTKTSASGSPKKDNALESSRNTIDKSTVEHIRQVSDPAGARKKGASAQKLSDRYPLSVDPTPNKQEGTKEGTSENVNKNREEKLFYADSGVYKCEEVVDDYNVDVNCDYTVQEPLTPSSDAKERKSSGPLCEYLEKLEKFQRKKRKKHEKRPSQESGSSSTAEKRAGHNRTGNNVKELLCLHLS